MAYSLFTPDLFYNGAFPAWVSHQPDSTPSQSSPNKVTIGSSFIIKLKSAFENSCQSSSNKVTIESSFIIKLNSAFIRVAVSLPIAFLKIWYKRNKIRC